MRHFRLLIGIIFFLIYNPIYSLEKENILVISSKSTDNSHVETLFRDLAERIQEDKRQVTIKYEELNCLDWNESFQWGWRMRSILKKYSKYKLKALILVGSEALGTYLGLDSVPNVPYYVCGVCRDGIIIPEHLSDSVNWKPKYTNLFRISMENGGCNGGSINFSRIQANVRLCNTFYPSNTHIALLTDNSYAGVSLREYFCWIMKSFYEDKKVILLDGSKYSNNQLKYQIEHLPEHTIVLIGTWRVSEIGKSLDQSSLINLFKNVPKQPVFSLLGIGIGDVAIGGFVPTFDCNHKQLLDAIFKTDKTINKKEFIKEYFTFDTGEYIFSGNLMNRFNILSSELPAGSIISDSNVVTLHRYKRYNLFISTVLLLSTLCLLLMIMIYRSKKRTYRILKNQQRILQDHATELAIAKDKAETSDRLKSAFLANMSHEIRTPLNAIVGFSQLIKDEEDQEAKEEYWRLIDTNNTLLLELINDILDISKIEAGMVELRVKEFDLSETFNTIYASLKSRYINRTELEFICVNPYSECLVTLDESRLIQVITNFVTNAFKFTKSGSITLGYIAVDDGIRIYCRDTGIGIAEADMDSVFNRFQQCNDFAQGTGLGMAICKALADLQHGKIGVDSKKGAGSNFWFWIPCKAVITNHSDNEEMSQDQPSISNCQDVPTKVTIDESATHPSKSIKVLVAEDNESNFLLIQTLLHDYSVDRAENGRVAVDKVQHNKYDVVLMDIRMPEVDGLEATRMIRRFNTQVVIIALTANAFEFNRTLAIEAGCNYFLTKPVDRIQLLDLLHQIPDSYVIE